MRCVATARSTGVRCGRSALPGGRYCRYHGSTGRQEAAGEPLYPALLDDEAPDLEAVAAVRGVDDEIALLRMLIRKVAREGDVEATRRAIDTLCRALKVQYALDGKPADGLSASLARVLDEIGNEMGMAL
jgi:hypothetical protein